MSPADRTISVWSWLGPNDVDYTCTQYMFTSIICTLLYHIETSLSSEEARPQVVASSKKKALGGCCPQTPAGHFPPATGWGILAFSRARPACASKRAQRLDQALEGRSLLDAFPKGATETLSLLPRAGVAGPEGAAVL